MKKNTHHRTVESLMSTGVLSVREGEPIAKALDIMSTAALHHLPVVDGRGHLLGLLSDRDLLRGLAGDKNSTDPVGAVMTRLKSGWKLHYALAT